MKLTNRKIIADVNTLLPLSQRVLPVKAGFVIAKNLNKIEDILTIYNKERQKLIEKYCEKDEEGNLKTENNSYEIKEGLKEDFNKESEELLEIENEVDIHKFSLADLGDTKLPIAELQTIEYMITEE